MKNRKTGERENVPLDRGRRPLRRLMDHDAAPIRKPFAGFEWMLALRYLRARRKEGFISVIAVFSFLGIMLGVATLIVVMAVMNGFRTELLDKILGFTGHATLADGPSSRLPISRRCGRGSQDVPGVKSVIPFVEGQAMASSQRKQHGRSGARHARGRSQEACRLNQQDQTEPRRGPTDASLRASTNRTALPSAERLAWNVTGLGLAQYH